MHVKANLLDGICNVRASKRLLQGSNHTEEELLRGGSEDDVIHIQEQVYCLGAASVYE